MLALLKGKFHIDLSQYKFTTIRRRVLRRMALSQITDVSGYADHLRAHSDLALLPVIFLLIFATIPFAPSAPTKR